METTQGISSNKQQNPTLAYNDAAVLKHMEMYQDIITRMANNSAACKKWGLPLITAILAFVVKDQQYSLVWLAIIAILLFYALDAYYLMLENRFRKGFELSAKKIQNNHFTQSDLFQLKPAGSTSIFLLKAFTSPATWPVYLGMMALSIFAWSWS